MCKKTQFVHFLFTIMIKINTFEINYCMEIGLPGNYNAYYRWKRLCFPTLDLRRKKDDEKEVT